ncbi:MAG: DEAD/DEAH box helicase [bacterium]
MESTPTPLNGFAGLGLSPVIMTALEKQNFVTPTPIQAQAIPIAVTGKDVIGIAQTGTGKTLAFSLPILQRLSAEQGNALILLPTRELALQVQENIRKISPFVGQPLRSCVLIGGASIYGQIQELRRHPRIIIATPGRLIDHLTQGNIKLDQVKVLVLDEADRMLDMGFAPQLRRIMETVPKERQTLFFSATMPSEILSLVNTYLNNPARVEVAPAGTSAELVEQELCYASQMGKLTILETLLAEYKGTILVFSRTKHGATKIMRKVEAMGHKAAEIHSNKSLSQRRQALDGFKSGRYRVLIATDIAARGIDVTGIELVINFDLPDAPEDYIHRIGRTGRAGREGKAISLATPDQQNDVRRIERLVGKPLKISHLSELRPAQPSRDAYHPKPTHSSHRPGQKRRPHFRSFNV